MRCRYYWDTLSLDTWELYSGEEQLHFFFATSYSFEKSLQRFSLCPYQHAFLTNSKKPVIPLPHILSSACWSVVLLVDFLAGGINKTIWISIFLMPEFAKLYKYLFIRWFYIDIQGSFILCILISYWMYNLQNFYPVFF